MDRSPTLHQVSSNDITINDWIFGIIEPYLKGRVLEVSSTLNSISTAFVQKERRIHLSNPDQQFCVQLGETYRANETVRMVHHINFHCPDFEAIYPETLRVFDTIVALNAMENDVYDEKVNHNCRHLLRARGRLIILAPVYTALFNGLDEDIKALKSYNRNSIKHLLTDKMQILKTRYFNLSDSPGYDRCGLSVIVVARKKVQSDLTT